IDNLLSPNLIDSAL
nr:glia-derived nexin, GDN, protease nexin-1 [rats, brain, Peptide Recombinant Partial, 14 aa] [Rattus sp.]